jgi:hypothetical protein
VANRRRTATISRRHDATHLSETYIRVRLDGWRSGHGPHQVRRMGEQLRATVIIDPAPLSSPGIRARYVG